MRSTASSWPSRSPSSASAWRPRRCARGGASWRRGARALQRADIGGQLKTLRAQTAGILPESPAQAVLTAEAAEVANVLALPRPSETHTSPALEEAARAAVADELGPQIDLEAERARVTAAREAEQARARQAQIAEATAERTRVAGERERMRQAVKERTAASPALDLEFIRRQGARMREELERRQGGGAQKGSHGGRNHGDSSDSSDGGGVGRRAEAG
jgi:hypothetical protein